MSKCSDNSISFGLGLLFGVLGGVAAGILYSPKPGNEMRQDLKEAAGSIYRNLSPEADNSKTATLDIVNKVKFSVENQISRINDAIKAGKMAAAKRREELESDYNY